MTMLSENPLSVDLSNKISWPSPASEFVYTRTYSRWMEEEGRRELWPETVNRYMNFIYKHLGDKVPEKVYRKIQEGIINFGVMPSMRALWAAGPAAEADNTCMYNCSFQSINKIEAFSECLYVLMCGTGYGFSVEEDEVAQLPVVREQQKNTDLPVHVVEDDKKGWADSQKILIQRLYEGHDIKMDYSQIRKEGARLKTMGGRASGPAPLVSLHEFTRDVFRSAKNRKLKPIECHDILCQTADIVVVGGVRRSSLISLSNLSDEEMGTCKIGNFPARRYMSNNSAIYDSKPTATEFLKEWSTLASSGSGERGIFNRSVVQDRAPKRRNRWKILGTNPCAEISMRSEQFCNLSEAVVRHDDDLDSMLDKVTTATWIGCIQSTFTHLPYLNQNWIDNCEEERLLGVSLTGQMDNPELMTKSTMKALKSRAIKTAKHASNLLGINMSASVTTVKPSGTVSQLVDCASGKHRRFSKFFLRRYRINSSDPLFKMLVAQGFSLSAENKQSKSDWEMAEAVEDVARRRDRCPIYQEGESWSPDKVRTWVIAFPMKSPENAALREEASALQQLEYYKTLQDNWCEHNTSCTIYVKDEEWMEVGNWVYQNWSVVCGVSFLPYDGGIYEQAPYEEITEQTYKEKVDDMAIIDYSALSRFEVQDNTSGSKSYACTGDLCELS